MSNDVLDHVESGILKPKKKRLLTVRAMRRRPAAVSHKVDASRVGSQRINFTSVSDIVDNLETGASA